MSRFDYVKYDDQAIEDQKHFKDQVADIEANILELQPSRAVALALTKLEECYMWIGKAIRDDQIERNGKIELQEERSNS